jgi:hypothetical protein
VAATIAPTCVRSVSEPCALLHEILGAGGCPEAQRALEEAIPRHRSRVLSAMRCAMSEQACPLLNCPIHSSSPGAKPSRFCHI